MGRNSLNNCSYFPLDTNMGDHRKVKIIRNKFGQVLGFAFWAMMLSHLTGEDGNEMEYSEMEFEMFAAKLGCTNTEVKEMIDFCIKIELLFYKDEFIWSESLNEKLAPVYQKRNRARDISATKKRRNNGTFVITVTEKPSDPVLLITDSPQSRIDKSKVDNKLAKANDTAQRNEFDKMLERDLNTIGKFITDHKPKFSAPYMEMWNLFAYKNGLPKILDCAGSRRGKLASRLREDKFDFVLILKRVRTQKLALEGSWFTFDWLIKNDDNYKKILEGNYVRKDDPKVNAKHTDSSQFEYPDNAA
jgi:hypothetical protein